MLVTELGFGKFSVPKIGQKGKTCCGLSFRLTGLGKMMGIFSNNCIVCVRMNWLQNVTG